MSSAFVVHPIEYSSEPPVGFAAGKSEIFTWRLSALRLGDLDWFQIRERVITTTPRIPTFRPGETRQNKIRERTNRQSPGADFFFPFFFPPPQTRARESRSTSVGGFLFFRGYRVSRPLSLISSPDVGPHLSRLHTNNSPSSRCSTVTDIPPPPQLFDSRSQIFNRLQRRNNQTKSNNRHFPPNR